MPRLFGNMHVQLLGLQEMEESVVGCIWCGIVDNQLEHIGVGVIPSSKSAAWDLS